MAGNSYNVLLRLCVTLKPSFDKIHKVGDIEQVAGRSTTRRHCHKVAQAHRKTPGCSPRDKTS